MAKSEKIKGSAIAKIFDELIHYKTFLKLNLLDSDYNQLTRITALAECNHEPHFVIDTPAGFENTAVKKAAWRMHFEFTARDQITYGFKTFGGEIHGQRTFIKMPRVVERNQRRELFRIHAPAGTKLCLALGDIRPELEVINLSVGGSLAALVRTDSDLKESAPFGINFLSRKAELVFPAEIMPQSIQISTIQIKRVKLNTETNRYEVALEFYEIAKSEERKLTDLIYQIQRQQLRKRLPLDI